MNFIGWIGAVDSGAAYYSEWPSVGGEYHIQGTICNLYRVAKTKLLPLVLYRKRLRLVTKHDP